MRPVIAFLVAPLVVPLFLLPSLYSGMPDRFWFAVTLIMAAIAAYAGTFFFGLPAYLFLRARKWTSFWIAPVLGFIAGSLAYCVLVVLFAVSLGNRLSSVMAGFSNVNGLRDLLWPIGPQGALVGALLWLIARPDRAPPGPGGLFDAGRAGSAAARQQRRNVTGVSFGLPARVA
jgi:hypothetical protein